MITLSNYEKKKLCLELIKANNAYIVIQILKNYQLWNDISFWKPYGGYSNNWNSIGNQMSNAEAALVEKIVNSIDSRLTNECLALGIDPASDSAPKSMQEATARFFENSGKNYNSFAGIIGEWDLKKRTEVAKGIAVAVTGEKSSTGYPCFSISDCGEGQFPNDFPNTFLSLTKDNKVKIPFVQGKYNMGGSGALIFCEKGLQLIVSRRNPKISNHKSSEWGFTIVRRQEPSKDRLSSIFTYLAPESDNFKDNIDNVLSFQSDTMPIFPNGQDAYSRVSTHGTLIKLYEYKTKKRTHMFLSGGIQERLDILLPDVALPIRLYECRDYRGHSGSFETNLTGLKVRLREDKGENLENDFPDSSSIHVNGQKMEVTIYAFKKDKSKTYKGSEGILFTINGQTHATIENHFFRRVKMDYLRQDILVIVDCSKFTAIAREDLFKNSRDRLNDTQLKYDIEKELGDLISKHPGLRSLRERRRREEIESKLENSKPLADILEKILKKSPTLSKLFLFGNRISTPFKPNKVDEGKTEYSGKKFPTFFKMKNVNYGKILHRNCHLNSKCRITFETDAENDFFVRDIDSGSFDLFLLTDDSRSQFMEIWNYNLHNGIATLNLTLPKDVTIENIIRFETIVSDIKHVQPFINIFEIKVMEPLNNISSKSQRRRPPTKNRGDKRYDSGGIALPEIFEVHENEWESKNFNKFTALKVLNTGNGSEGSEDDEDVDTYDFYVNVDNVYLKSEIKNSLYNPDILKSQFVHGNVLMGLAILQDDKSKTGDFNNSEISNDGKSVGEKIDDYTKAVAPILLPMIDSLGGLTSD